MGRMVLRDIFRRGNNLAKTRGKMTADEILNHILTVFDQYKNNAKILKRLKEHDLIHPSFEQRYILNNDEFQFSVISSANKNDGLVEFYLESKTSCPYRAEVVFDGKWYLKSLLFQCQGCFGDDSKCGVCGGSGWGAL